MVRKVLPDRSVLIVPKLDKIPKCEILSNFKQYETSFVTKTCVNIYLSKTRYYSEKKDNANANSKAKGYVAKQLISLRKEQFRKKSCSLMTAPPVVARR